ncbi:MAG TPA: cytochrome c peroxidase [Spirillospora sp.]|nr:cytochrome c peroxidase [Spirillospora sp.]
MRRIIWMVVAVLSLVGLAVQAQVPEPTPLPLYALPDVRLARVFTSGTLALSNDGRVLVATNMLNNSLSFVDAFMPNNAQLIQEVPVGPDPRGVALTPDNQRALVVLRGDNSLAVIDFERRAPLTTIPLGGSLPYAVVSHRVGYALVSLQASNEVVEVDLEAGAVVRRIPVPASPAGLAVWGDFLYVTHFWSGSLSLVYLPRGEVIDVIRAGPDTGISQSIDIDVQRGLAYLPQTRQNAENRYPTFDTTVFPVVNVVDLRGLRSLPRQRIDLSTADRPVNMPFAAVVDRFRNWLYVANAGSNDVSVIDLNTGLARASIRVGSNPRGVLLNRDNTYLFVHNVIDGTLTIIETSRLQVMDVLPISTPVISNDILIGAELFHSAADPRLSEDRWLSCATCHFDGLPDGRTWQGVRGGPRNTPPLFDLIETAPYTWTGRWDELQDVELKIRSLLAGTGLIEDFPIAPADGTPHGGLSFDLDLLAAYLLSLRGPANPNQFDDALVARGRAVFEAQGCGDCHSGPAGTDLQTHAVGTGQEGQEFDTPSLRYLWLSAPYFHDGSAATLMDVFTLPGAHQLNMTVERADLDALIAYLLSWA